MASDTPHLVGYTLLVASTGSLSPLPRWHGMLGGDGVNLES